MAETLGERFKRLQDAAKAQPCDYETTCKWHDQTQFPLNRFSRDHAFAAYILQLEQSNADHAAKVLELEGEIERLRGEVELLRKELA